MANLLAVGGGPAMGG